MESPANTQEEVFFLKGTKWGTNGEILGADG